MRLTQRLAFNSFLIIALLMALVLAAVEWRVRHHVRAEGVSAAANDDVLLSQIRRDIGIAGIATLLIGVVLARALARPVARPIEELRDIARSLAAGDLSRRPSRTITGGEVGDLADALRRMSEQLETRLWELQSEEALLVALTESLNEGVIAVDARKRVVRINERGRQMLGLRQALPFPSSELPMESGLQDSLQLVLSGSQTIVRELRIDERTLVLTVRPLRGGGAVLALLDLTPIRRLETVRSDFVANVSHELRTPLTIISGFVETLQDEELPPPLRRQFLGMAASNVLRMQRIVDDLLDLSRIESGGWVPDPEPLDLALTAGEVLAPLQERAKLKGVQLRTEIGVRWVFGDQTAVRQILSNLAENALRHTTAGKVELFSQTEGEGTWIGVRDTGSGIAAEHLPRIFERFYRADPGRSREAGGTGLGLAIVRHLTETHGGRVKAESTVGVGTTIAAWFPTPPSGASIDEDSD
ncbi:MAG: HAMP domain-containing protein [Gemmatimonadaceae bacterium]|nr:HAMP domain-containing protein [Gemmatimonadaceae bacterium]